MKTKSLKLQKLKRKMNDKETELLDDIISSCGEQLEMIDSKEWIDYLFPLLLRLLARERDEKNYYKKLGIRK